MPNDNAHINVAKKHFFTHALAIGEVSVQFLANTPGVEIPEFAMVDGVQTFIYGLNQPVPIPDLVIGVEGIRATLSFGRQPHMTFVPWAAVGAFVGETFGIVFPMAEASAPSATVASAPVPKAAPVTPRPRLSLVP
jgi:hypothetical protein